MKYALVFLTALSTLGFCHLRWLWRLFQATVLDGKAFDTAKIKLQR